MPKVDLPLTFPLGFRSADQSKDSKMVNCYKETIDKQTGKAVAVKRPGKNAYPIDIPLPAKGQGLWNYNGNLYAVANGTLYKITGGVRTTIKTGLSTTEDVSFVNTQSTTSPHPYMVFQDRSNGYFLDASGNVDKINGLIAQVVLQTGGTGYPASGTFTVSGTTGSGAVGTYVATAGIITTITLVSRGTNYSGTLTVAFSGGGSSAVATAALNSFPTNAVDGLVYLDGYVFAMDSQGQVWQSQQEDPTCWLGLNYLTVKGEPDQGVAIAKHYNYLVAFKQWTTEFLYDNANATGSVLSINESARIELGCAAGDSVQQFEETVIWMATPKEGGRIIARLEGLRALPISTPAIERYLNASDLSEVYCWAYKIAGHTFYGLVLTDQNITLVYDLNEKDWHVWTTSKQYVGGSENYFECSFVTPFPFGSENYYVLDAVNGLVFKLATTNYADPFGPIMMRVVTPNLTLGTHSRKTNSSLVLTGDLIYDTIDVRHSDNDYRDWSSYRKIDLSLQKPCLYNLGSFRKRAYEVLYTGNSPLRLETMELQVSGELGQEAG